MQANKVRIKKLKKAKNLTSVLSTFGILILSVITLAATPDIAHASTATWNGGTSSSWSEGANWTGGSGAGGLPGTTQDVDIASSGNQPTMDVFGGATVVNLLVEDGMNLTLDGTNSLTITGNCTLGSSTTGILTTNGSVLSISGTLTGAAGGSSSGKLDISANTSNVITITWNIFVETIIQGTGSSHVIFNGIAQQINGYIFNTLEITGTVVMEDNERINLNLIGTGTLNAGSYVLKLMQDMTITHFTASTSLVELIGTTSTQNIGPASGSYTFKDFGLYNVNTNLLSSIKINDNIDFGASGDIYLNGYNLTISPSANGSGPNAVGSGHAVSQNANAIDNNYAGGYGYVISNKGNNGGAFIQTVATSPTVFPVGANASSYSPLTLTLNTGTSVMNVSVADRLLDGKNPQDLLFTSGSDYAVIKTWRAINTTDVPHITINTTWHAPSPNTGDEDASFEESQAYIAYRLNQAPGTSWAPLGATTGSTATSSATDYYNLTDQAASHLHMAAGTDYYISTYSAGASALPVSLISFGVKYINNKVKINWATASETNNAYFNIERSPDAVKWTTIGKVDGHGTSEIFNYYNSIDDLSDVVPSGTFYYRLRQVDYNGTFRNSSIKSLDISTQQTGLQAYPNPANNLLNVSWMNTSGEGSILKITSTSGVNLFRENIAGDGLIQKQIDLSTYPAGSYFIQIINGQGTMSQIINKN